MISHRSARTDGGLYAPYVERAGRFASAKTLLRLGRGLRIKAGDQCWVRFFSIFRGAI